MRDGAKWPGHVIRVEPCNHDSDPGIGQAFHKFQQGVVKKLGLIDPNHLHRFGQIIHFIPHVGHAAYGYGIQPLCRVAHHADRVVAIVDRDFVGM